MRGKVKKSVTVVTNDPATPNRYLHVEAFVKADVGFEEYNIHVDNIRSNDQVVKEAHIALGDLDNIEIAEITTSSEFIKARQLPSSDTLQGQKRIKIEITIGPGLKAGLLSESVTVRFKDDIKPKAQLPLYGVVVDDVEVTPLTLTYVITDSINDPAKLLRRLVITNYREDQPLEIGEVRDPGNYLDLFVRPMDAGKKFEVTVKMKEPPPSVDSVLSGEILINTNSQKQPVVKVPYRIVPANK